MITDLELRKALRKAAGSMGVNTARFLVDSYYQMQELRITADNRVRAEAQGVDANPAAFMETLSDFHAQAEKEIAVWLDKYSNSVPLGQWARSQKGVGPVIAAGLLAHIDLDVASSPSAVWRFAGLDPTSVWEKGQKRPFNAALKTLCWKLGESFIKVQQYEDAVYGHLYAARKRQEWAANTQEKYAHLIGQRNYKYSVSTESYKWTARFYSGVDADGKPIPVPGAKDMTEMERADAGGLIMIPPQAIHGRARRYAVKMFLSHYWAVGYEIKHGKPAPNPWIIEHGGHVDLMPPPNWPMAA